MNRYNVYIYIFRNENGMQVYVSLKITNKQVTVVQHSYIPIIIDVKFFERLQSFNDTILLRPCLFVLGF